MIIELETKIATFSSQSNKTEAEIKILYIHKTIFPAGLYQLMNAGKLSTQVASALM